MDYEAYKLIWWLIIGILLIGFAIMDGHDMGVGTLLPVIGKDDEERRVMINSIAPHWDGNQVWFITAGGALFAAWPLIYATAFSGFYWAMFGVLWSLFLRPVGFDYRSKLQNEKWRKSWDWALFLGGFVPPILFGVAFGNLLQGVPFTFDRELVSYYTGSFWQLLNPFALLCGAVSSSMITFQGAVYLMHRTEGEIYDRSRKWVFRMGPVLLFLFSVAGLWLFYGIDGYVITSSIDPNGVPDPTTKTVAKEAQAWFANYYSYPLLLIVPSVVYIGVLLAIWLDYRGKTFKAFIASSLAIAGVVGTVGVSMFPFLMPSSSVPDYSLTAWDSVSSKKTLAIMLAAVVIFMPLIIAYTSWAYKVMGGKVTKAYIRQNSKSVY